jgi:DnaJ-class molecular chaperone
MVKKVSNGTVEKIHLMIHFPGKKSKEITPSLKNDFSFSFFGDFFPFGGGSRDDGHGHVPRGGDLVMDIYVTLEEVFNGNFIEVDYQQYKCSRCQ